MKMNVYIHIYKDSVDTESTALSDCQFLASVIIRRRQSHFAYL